MWTSTVARQSINRPKQTLFRFPFSTTWSMRRGPDLRPGQLAGWLSHSGEIYDKSGRGRDPEGFTDTVHRHRPTETIPGRSGGVVAVAVRLRFGRPAIAESPKQLRNAVSAR